jgi:hypothetical protein
MGFLKYSINYAQVLIFAPFTRLPIRISQKDLPKYLSINYRLKIEIFLYKVKNILTQFLTVLHKWLIVN